MNRLFIRSVRIALSLMGLLIIIATSASTFNSGRSADAAYNAQINYQGKLTNGSNVAVADGTYNMEFKFYDAVSSGTLLWTETRTGGNKVQVTNGVFSVMLGEVNPFGSLDFNQTLFLSVNIGGTGSPSWDGEMTPRKKIGTVPVAFLASNLKGTGLIDITNTSTQATFNYDGSNKATLAVASTGFTTLNSVGSGAGWNLTGGNVGIGDATPASLLTVGSGDAFQVNSSGAIAAATGITSSGTITFSGLGGSGTQCVQVSNTGVVSGTGAVCGAGSSGDSISVNGSAATDANFINTAASGSNASVTWSLNTTPNPDEVSIVIGAASATEAGIITTGTQTLAGAKTFTSDLTVTKADPSLVLNVTTSGDTDFWLGVQDDGGGDNDDVFQIGKGAAVGTTPYLTINQDGNVGIGNSNPSHLLDTAWSSTSTTASSEIISLLTVSDTGVISSGFDDVVAQKISLTRTGAGAGGSSTASGSIINTLGDANVSYLSGLTATAQGGYSNYAISANALVDSGQDYNTAQSYALSGTSMLFGDGIMADARGLDLIIENGGTGSVISEASGTVTRLFVDDVSNTVGTFYGNRVEVGSNSGTITNTYGYYVGDITSGTQTNQAYGLYVSDANARNYFAGNLGIGDSSPSSLFTVGSGDLFQINSTGQIGSQQSPVSDYLFALAGTTGNDHSRVIDIVQANDSAEDTYGINLSVTSNSGTISGSGVRAHYGLNTSVTPAATASSGLLDLYGTRSVADLTSVTLGNSTTDTSEIVSNGLYSAVTGNPTFNHTSGANGAVVSLYGVQGVVTTSPVLANVSGAATLEVYGGLFNGGSTFAAGNGNLTVVNYGIKATTGANLTTTGNTSHYGAYFTTNGSADNNYALYAEALSPGATNNYAAILMGGNVGIGTNAPQAKLHVSGTSDVGIDVQSTTDGGAGITFRNDNYRSWSAGLFSSLGDHNFAIKDQTANTFRFHIGSTGNVGLSTTAADKRLEINEASGNNLRLTYNDADGSATNFVDFLTTSSGALTIQPSGFIVNVGGSTSRTALRFLEPSGTGTDYTAIQANANVTTSYTWTLPAADASGCIQSNGSGTLSIGSCGGALTPWTSDVDADGFDLADLSNILFRETTGAPTGTDVGLYRDNSGDLTGNVLTGKTFNLAVNGTDEYNFSSTGLAFNSNNITGLGTNVTATAGLTITSTSANLAFTTATSGNITFAPASTGSVQLTSGVNTGTTTSSGLSIAANSLTSGSAVYVASSTLSSGSLVDLQVSGTAGASSQKVLNAVTTGAITGTQTTYGGFFSNTHSGGTSTNIGLYSTASGGTNNYAAIFDAGNVGIGTTAPGQKLAVAGNIDLNVNGSPAIGNYTFGGNSISFANTGQISITAPNALTTVNGGWTSSSASQVGLSISGTVAQTSVAAYTGLLIAPTISTQGAGPNYLFDAQGTSSSRVVITTAGDMGVGTTGPDRKLDVLDASNPQIRLTTTDGTVYSDMQNTANANLVVTGSNLASSSAQQFGLQIAPTVNQTSTASYRALDVNVTETGTTTSGLNRLADFRVGGSSKVAISNNGSITLQNASNLITPYGGIGDFQNHLVRSEEFDNASWVKTSVTAPTANTQVAPDGSTSAESLATSGSGGDVCQWSGTAAGSGTFTFSVWARSTTGTQNFDMRVDAGSTSCATANNVTGTAVTHTATTSWQRFTVTQTFSSATGNVKVRIFPGTTGSTGTIYAWAAQLDQSSRPSNYVMTTGGALTNTNRGIVLESNLATTSGFSYGGRQVTTLTGAISASSTTVGQLMRVIDNATGTDDTATVRALEVQSFSGTNLNGINTAVAAFGYTFGVHAATTGQANEAAQPAAVFADLDNGSATTQGNAIRAYTNDATSADLVSFYQETSAYTGNGLVMNFGNNSGSFSGNFLNLKAGGTTKAHIDSNGYVFASLTSSGTAALCWDGTGGTDERIQDCSGAPVADYAEMYPVTQDAEVGDIMVIGNKIVNTYDINNRGAVDWGKVKGTINQLVKSTGAYQSTTIGVVSDNYGDFSSTGYNLKDEDNPKAIALKGRIPVKVTNENGPIKAGDYITTSATVPGYGMKATRSGQMVGQALADLNFEDGSTGQVMIFVQVGFQNIGNTIVLDAPAINGANLQSGDNNSLTNTASTFVIQQQTFGDSNNKNPEANILQLQTGDANRFMVSSSGATSILSNLNCEADADSCPSVLKVTQANTELMNIDARGTLTLAGTIFIKDDSFAGSVATDAGGLAEITFSYNLGTGKPVVQLTPEAQLPVFAQIVEFKQDEAGNYTGFVMKTFDLMSSPVRSVVHYTVVGKQAGYITLGEVTVPEEDLSVQSDTGDSGEGVGLIIGNDDVAGGNDSSDGDNSTTNSDFTPSGSNDNISSGGDSNSTVNTNNTP